MGRRIALGVILIAAGFAAAVAIAVPSLVGIKERIEAFPQTRLSEGAVQLERGEYDVFIEVPSGTGDFAWTLYVGDDAGGEVPLRMATSTITYDWFGREGWLAGTLRVTRPGRHLVRGTGPAGAEVVFADDVIGDIGRSLLLAGVALFGLAAAGVVVIVLAFARRRPREPKRWP